MATYAIGDIHGCLQHLESVVRKINPTPDDHLVFLGDYIDRGPQSKEVVDYLISLAERVRCTFLKGNHEVHLLNCRDSRSDFNLWMYDHFGGRKTTKSYGYVPEYFSPRWTNSIPDDHWDFFENLKDYLETEEALFIHAGYRHDEDAYRYSEMTMFWSNCLVDLPYKGTKKVFVGHTPTADNHPVFGDARIMCDTGCGHPNGVLTAVHVESCLNGAEPKNQYIQNDAISEAPGDDASRWENV